MVLLHLIGGKIFKNIYKKCKHKILFCDIIRLRKQKMKICGKEVPDQKAIIYALRYIQGIGLTTAKNMCTSLKIPFIMKAGDLNDAQRQSIEDYVKIKKIPLGEDLMLLMLTNIRKKVSLGTRSGKRHVNKLPQSGSGRSNGATVKKRTSVYGGH